jgi:hypothetical protein
MAGTWSVGQKVKCPICGREGVAAYSIFRQREKEYRYRVVRHEGGTYCVVGRELEDGRVVPVKRRRTEGKRLPLDAFAREEGAGGGSSIPALNVDPVELNKALWYSQKIFASWGSLRQAVEQLPPEECLVLFKRTVAETGLRRGIDGTKLVKLAEKFVNAASDEERAKLKGELNLAVKEFCKEMVLKVLNAK